MSEYANKKIEIKGIGTIHYEPIKCFQKRYPKEIGGYKVIGAIGKTQGKSIGEFHYETYTIEYYELCYSKLKDGVIGYIEIEEHVYIAIVVDRIMHRFLLLMMSVIVLGAILCGIYYGIMNHNNEIESSLEKYKSELKSPNIEKNTILIPGYGDIVIKDNSDTAYISLWNPDKNSCYFKFKIILDNENKSIYESKLIPPGYAITEVVFDQEFSKGEYPVTIQIECYDMEDRNIRLNGGEVKTRIVAVKEE